MILQVPKRFDYHDIYPFIESLQLYIDEPEISLNFENINYTYPLPMLVIGSAIRKFVKKRKHLHLKTSALGLAKRNYVHSYLEHLGFFDFITLDHGKKMGQAKGSPKYIPIKELNKKSIVSRISPPYIQLRHVIAEDAKSLADVLVHSKNEDSKRAITYSIREIIRNVFEHSEAEYCYMCGQRWNDGSVEIAIIDEGIGIKESLSKNYEFSSDIDALKEAMHPGVSGKNVFSEEENIHSNSGFGLYVLSQLGKKYGWFSIGSGNSRIKLSPESESCDNLFHSGTFVGLHINREPENFGKVLDDIISNGEFEAYVMGRQVKASSSSREFY